MTGGRIKKLVAVLALVVGGAAVTALTASPSSALDCSAYEVDSYVQNSCNFDTGRYNQRQCWTYYRPSGCNPGTQTVCGPWYTTNGRCGFGGGGK